MLIALLLLVGGCSQPAEPAGESTVPAGSGQPDQADKLVGVTWNCFEFKVAGAPQTVPADTPITAEFAADGALSGKSAVNTYNTTYTTDGDGMTIGPEIASTKMAGPEEAMNLESNYLTTLPTTVRYNILNSGELVLLDAADSAVARYRPAE
jgi:heat shock protein HslJ